MNGKTDVFRKGSLRLGVVLLFLWLGVPLAFATPTATTDPVTNLASTSATLNGLVNPNGQSTDVRFEYGFTAAYGNLTSAQSIGSGTSAIAVNATVNTFARGTIYHYRTVAISGASSVYGNDQVFTTSCTLCSFPSTSRDPYSGLLQAGDGNFYGTTYSGGTNSYGTVYKLTTSGNLTTLHSFSYTATGAYPYAGLTLASDGYLYGTTYNGGAYDNGTVFRITTGGVLTTLYAFSGGANGSNPRGELIQLSDGNLYGTTYQGGASGYGTVFRITTAGSLTTLHSFGYTATGANPYAGLVQAGDGNLYGTTHSGGVNGGGTVFKLTLSGSVTKLCDFTSNGAVGYGPNALTVANDGNLYGTNYSGGTYGYGTVFRITTSGSLAGIYSFDSASGANPYGELIKANDGNLYGSSYYGGATNYGVVFKIATTGSLAVVYSFNASSGYNPRGSLTQGIDGALYGVTENGGAGYGTVFVLPLSQAITSAATGIGAVGATLNGIANPNGISTTTQFEYGLTVAYGSTTSSQSVGSGSASIAVSSTLTGLIPISTYHYRIKTTSGTNIFTGEDATFTTLPLAPDSVTGGVANVSSTTATIQGTLNPNGGAANRWFDYGASATYGSSTSLQSVGSGTTAVVVSSTVSGLGPNTLYHYRLSASNVSGTASGVDQTFTTLPLPPAVISATNTGISTNQISVRGTLNPNSGDTSFRVDYGLTTSYGNSTAPLAAGSGTSSVTVNADVSGLQPNTLYHFRIAATNPGGTTYGVDQTFKTLPLPPAVTTGTASAIGSITATIRGTINPNGDSTIVRFEYGPTADYGITTGTLAIGSGTAVVTSTSSMTALQPNTTYHYRAKATNLGGTSYGLDQTFTTLPLAPIVTSGTASVTGPGTAAIAATVNPNGGGTAGYFQYGTTTSYGNTTSTQDFGSSIGDIPTTVNLTGLQPNTLYHYRIAATNPGGTTYGVDQTFKTLPLPPTVVTGTASAIGSITATIRGTTNPNGDSTTVQFEYGLTADYGITTGTLAIGSGTAVVTSTSSMTALQPNTTYHYRAKAMNLGGTSYGLDQTITTLPLAPIVTSGTATVTGPGTATITATVDPNGGAPPAAFNMGRRLAMGILRQFRTSAAASVIFQPLSI